MKRYIYCYETVIHFGTPVANHSILLRCEPRPESYLTIEDHHFIGPPDFRLNSGADAFGNGIIYGSCREPHNSLAYLSAGIVRVEPYYAKEGGTPSPVFLQPTPLTLLPDGMGETGGKDAAALALRLCERVNGLISYTPDETTTDTSAQQVLQTRKGVCQDFAHVFIALCRQSGLPARYVCGFLEGTGKTHAWAEVFDGYRWLGFDPTHNRQAEYGYVKIAHGRDAADCAVSRGIYGGEATQDMQVNVSLVEI